MYVLCVHVVRIRIFFDICVIVIFLFYIIKKRKKSRFFSRIYIIYKKIL